MNSHAAHLIRTTAALAVVLLHVAAFGLQQWNPDWALCNWIDSAVRICVPLFFMLSGALLLKKEEPLALFLQKRFTRILLPLAFWSYFFIAWRIYAEGDLLSWSPVKLLAGPVYYHLWYLYAIVGLYLALPILRVVYRHAALKLQVYMLACWFAGASLLPILLTVAGKQTTLELNYIPQFAAYFFLGALLTERRLPLRWAAGLYLAGWIATALLTSWWSHRLGAMNQLFYQYTAPNVAIAAIGAFALLLRAGERLPQKLGKPLAIISDCSFGIYFIHLPVLHALSEGWFGFEFEWNSFTPLLAIPALTLSAFVISWAIIWLLRLIPGLKRVV